MDTDQQKMKRLLGDLDHRLSTGDADGARRCALGITRLCRSAPRGTDLGPAWLSSLVRNGGVRLPALERAVGTDKVVVSGGLEVQHNLRRALRGEQPLRAKVQGGWLELKIDF